MNKIYVFDLDGTLIDSMPSYARVVLEILDEEGVTYGPELIKILTPLGNHKVAQYYIDHYGLKKSEEEIVERIERNLIYAYSNLIPAKAGVCEMLERLHARGDRLFVLTASPHITTDACLKKNGVFDLFEQVWSVEDYGINKSDIRLFYQLAERIGCRREEIHYFDDSLVALTNAKSAGLITYGVYDAQDEDEVAQMKRDYDFYVSSFAEFDL